MPAHGKFVFHTLFLTLCSAGLCAAEPAPSVVAALEQTQCAEPPTIGVRPLFQRVEGKWTAVDEPARVKWNQAVEWTIALDGKSLGTLRTAAASKESGMLTPLDPRQIPVMGNATQRFAGWCVIPARRPLLATSDGSFADPDQWRPLSAEAQQAEVLFPLLIEAAGATAPVCKEEAVQAWTFSAAELQVIGGYRNRHGQQLVGVMLDPKHNTCDGPAEDIWATHWFLMGQTTRYLGAGLELVEAADLDRDGTSELLFWHSAYNQDGYLLLHDQLSHSTPNYWSYH